MQFEIEGIINFEATLKLKLETAVSFNASSGIKTTLSSNSNKDLIVIMKIEADEASIAKEIATVELNRICDVISYFYNISILGCRITGLMSLVDTENNKYILTGESIVAIDAVLTKVLILEPKSDDRLSYYLEQEYLFEFENALSMWREAISVESPAMKYLLLYRMMELLFKSNTNELTAWIISKEPNVQTYRDRKRGKLTFYTYLRDNIHPKQKQFPIKEIKGSLPRFQDLVKQFIEEKFGYVNCSG